MVKLGIRKNVNNLTPTRLVGFDPNRTSLAIVKNDAGVLFINTDIEGTTIEEGFPIAASGGNISINDLFGSDPTIEYYGIVSGASGDVRILRSRSPILAFLLRIARRFLPKSRGPFN